MDYCALKCIPIRLLKTNNIVVQFLPNQKLQKMGILNGSKVYIHPMLFCFKIVHKLLKGIIRGQMQKIAKILRLQEQFIGGF